MKTLLAAPRMLKDSGVLAAVAARELIADRWAAPAFHADSTSSRLACAEPAWVIEPCRRLSPEERSEGTSPTKLMNCVGRSEPC